MAARPFQDVMEEIPYDATYEEFFGASPEETRPRLDIIAVVQRASSPAMIKAEDTLSPEVRFLNDSKSIPSDSA